MEICIDEELKKGMIVMLRIGLRCVCKKNILGVTARASSDRESYKDNLGSLL